MWLVTCPRQISAWFSELRFLNLQSENQLIETLFGLLQGGIKPDVTCSAKELFGAINPGIKYIASCLLLQVLNPSVFSCSCVPSCCRQTSFTVPVPLPSLLGLSVAWGCSTGRSVLWGSTCVTRQHPKNAGCISWSTPFLGKSFHLKIQIACICLTATISWSMELPQVLCTFGY